MSLKIIGAGFGRTGTYSMKLALEKLGYGLCHHMEEVYRRKGQAEIWQSAAEGKPVDWDVTFDQFQSAVDWPSSTFWEQTAAHFPEAKILLTVRSDESWYNSISKTIFPLISERAKDLPDGYHGQVVKMVHKLIIENTFGNNITDPEHVKAVFNAHNANVIDKASADRLLIYELGSGWEPLCQWLDVPVPDEPYPRSNSQEEFWGAVSG